MINNVLIIRKCFKFAIKNTFRVSPITSSYFVVNLWSKMHKEKEVILEVVFVLTLMMIKKIRELKTRCS